MIVLYNIIVVVIAWLLDLQLPVQSVNITTKVVSSNPGHIYYTDVFHTKLGDKVCQ